MPGWTTAAPIARATTEVHALVGLPREACENVLSLVVRQVSWGLPLDGTRKVRTLVGLLVNGHDGESEGTDRGDPVSMTDFEEPLAVRKVLYEAAFKARAVIPW